MKHIASRPEPTAFARRPASRILFATDLSARCDRALERAAMLAAETSTNLTVVHAFELDAESLTQDLPSVSSLQPERPTLKQAIAIKRLRQDLDQLDVPFNVVLEDGAPADVILRSANRLASDLIVAGIESGESFSRFMLGSTLDRVVRKASVPVLVVKNRVRAPYENVVVATDFSPSSRRAIDEAAGLFPQARIALFHCYEATPTLMSAPIGAPPGGRQLADSAYREFIDAEPASASRLASMPIYMEAGSIDRAIRACVAYKNPDLMIIATHGKNILTRALVGSTTESVIASAPTDVLVITPASRAA